LHAEPPAEFAAVDDIHLARFAGLIAAAKEKRETDLRVAVAGALDVLPEPMRGRVARVLNS
jgi:hypothetical protein